MACVARHAALAHFLAVVVERHVAALGQPAAVIGELHAHLVLALRNRFRGLGREFVDAQHVVGELELAVLGVHAPAAELAALRDDHAVGGLAADFDFGGDGERLVLDADHAVLRQASHAGEELLRIPLDQGRSASRLRNKTLHLTVIQRQDVVLGRLDQELPLQLVQHVGHLLRQVVRLRPVLAAVV